MDEATRLLEQIKVALLRKDETYRLIADCKPRQCDGCKGTGMVPIFEGRSPGSRPCSFCELADYEAWREANKTNWL
jgi:hypothetical protein